MPRGTRGSWMRHSRSDCGTCRHRLGRTRVRPVEYARCITSRDRLGNLKQGRKHLYSRAPRHVVSHGRNEYETESSTMDRNHPGFLPSFPPAPLSSNAPGVSAVCGDAGAVGRVQVVVPLTWST